MDLGELNAQQREALFNSLGEDDRTIVIAGAGSGKTRVLTSRIAHLVNDLNVSQKEIMAVTFTNKAANELKERLNDLVNDVHEMWIGTIHSICVRLLKELGSLVGITKFTIMDPKDQEDTIKEVLEKNNIPFESGKHKTFLEKISYFKNNMISYSKAQKICANDKDMLIAKMYKEYQDVCFKRKTFDFDDLIIYTIVLLTNSKDAREWIYDNIKYILIDEVQDNSLFQYTWLKLVSGDNNVFLVGDPDQSLYSFRYARPEYLHQYQEYYPDVKLYYLEQNYRSTKTIVEASNALIKHNPNRFDKTMFTNNPKGNPIVYYRARNIYDEAIFVVEEIVNLIDSGIALKDIAVIYRNNFQSRVIEERLVKENIHYQMFGGTPYYKREEVKDLLCYLHCYVNTMDEINYKRMLMLQPAIGKATALKILQFAEDNNMDYLTALDAFPSKNKTKVSLINLYKMMTDFYLSATDFFEAVLNLTDYKKNLELQDNDTARNKVQNIEELLVLASENSQTVDEFESRIMLMTDGLKKENKNKVKLTTIHLSKGLEFEAVFMIGVEDGILPSSLSLKTENGLYEERNAMYVGMTRAKSQLYITNVADRMNYNQQLMNQKPSRFIEEIPKKYILNVN